MKYKIFYPEKYRLFIFFYDINFCDNVHEVYSRETLIYYNDHIFHYFKDQNGNTYKEINYNYNENVVASGFNGFTYKYRYDENGDIKK